MVSSIGMYFNLVLAGLASLPLLAMGQDAADIKYKGAAWLQFGRVMHSTDSLAHGAEPNNMNGNWVQAAGVSVVSVAKFGPFWEGSMGIVALQSHAARGDVSVANNWYTSLATSVGEARVTYARPTLPDHKLQVNVGFFNYNYNPDVKNLGLYLLRGYVYPGTPISGFEARHTTPGANIFGAMTSYSIGGLKNDLLVISETENRPYFDISVADVITWQLGDAFTVAAGANLYRLKPRNPKNNSPGLECKNVVTGYNQIDPTGTEHCYILDTVTVDTVAGTADVDTIFGSMNGTKLMGRFRLDPKALFGLGGSLGKQDLVVYGELGVLGTKDYRKYYDDIKRRMPVMVGFNLPAYGWLDKLSLEVEYYASKNLPDYGKNETSYSWVPRTAYDEKGMPLDNGRDDWKWSLYFSKVAFGNLRFSGQVANDHLRLIGPPDIGLASYAEVLSTPRDWYWMFRTTCFF
jgi:hypothetical protein